MKIDIVRVSVYVLVISSLIHFSLIIAITRNVILNQKGQTITVYRTIERNSVDPLVDDYEKPVIYAGFNENLHRSEIFQRSCGTNFSDHHYGYWEARNSVMGDIPETSSPLLLPFSESLEIKNKVLILIYNEESPFIIHHWWVKRGIEEFKIEIHTVFNRESVISQVKNTMKEWIIICDSSTYLFLTNILHVLLRDYNGKSTLPLYLGYPFRSLLKSGEEMIYASMSSGIIMNRPAFSKLFYVKQEIPLFLDYSYPLDLQIGKILRQEEVYMIDLLGLNPDNPETMLRYLDNSLKLPSHYLRGENILESIQSPILSFGNIKSFNMDKFEKLHKIPKIVHQIWIGDQNERPNRELNECRTLFEISEWTYQLWTDENEIDIINRNLFDSLEEWNSKADILRYEILFRYGGIAMDADSECLRPMDDLIDQTYTSEFQIFAACENEKYRPGLIAAGVQGVASYSLSYYYILRSLHLLKGINELKKVRRSVGWIITGPVFFTQVVHSWGVPINVINSKYFYPVHHSEMEMMSFERVLSLAKLYNSYTVQFWGTTNLNLQ